MVSKSIVFEGNIAAEQLFMSENVRILDLLYHDSSEIGQCNIQSRKAGFDFEVRQPCFARFAKALRVFA